MRTTRQAGLGLAFVLLLIFSAPMARADQEVRISTFHADGMTLYVDTGQEVTLGTGWIACTRGLAEAYTHAAVIATDIQFDGSSFASLDPPGREYWSAPQPWAGDASACVAGNDATWLVAWSYPLGTLEQGEYEVAFTSTMSHPLPDGGDYDGDGRPDLLDSANSSWESHFTIIVS